MNRPKLIALDVDGTLIDHDQVLAERTIAAISAVRRTGIVVVIATGRPIPVIGPAADHADWLVGANGATVARADTLELLVDRVVPMDDVRALMALIRAAIPGVAAAVLTETESVFETGFEKFLPQSVARGRHVVDVLDARGAGARSWSVFHHTITAHEIAERVHAIVSPRYVAQMLGFPAAEVTEADVNKATGLAALTEHLGITAADVWAFGDGRNDHEMLEWAGRGHAMANADDDTKVKADVVVPSNVDLGVAVTLEALLA